MTAMDLTGVVSDLGEKAAITVTKRAAGSYVNGRHISGAETSVTMDAVVYPPRPSDLQKLPEGRRTEKVLAFLTKEELRSSEQGGVQADRIAYNGEAFEVEQVEDWSHVAGFWHALAVRVS